MLLSIKTFSIACELYVICDKISVGRIMRKKTEDFLYLILGFTILIAFYYASYCIVKLLHVTLPPAILGLILFSIALIQGIIKEKWIKSACEILMNNMAMFVVPLFCGLIVYKSILAKNWLAVFIVIFVTTSLIIVLTGLFTEWGIKLLRLNKIKEPERGKK